MSILLLLCAQGASQLLKLPMPFLLPMLGVAVGHTSALILDRMLQMLQMRDTLLFSTVRLGRQPVVEDPDAVPGDHSAAHRGQRS